MKQTKLLPTPAGNLLPAFQSPHHKSLGGQLSLGECQEERRVGLGRNWGGMQLQVLGIHTSIMKGMMGTRAELLPLSPSSAPQTQRGNAPGRSPAALLLGNCKESFKSQLGSEHR